MPDLTIVLDMPAAAAAARIRRPRDRMEQQGDEFHARVREGFLAEAARRPGEITVVIDASGSVEQVQADIRAAVGQVMALDAASTEHGNPHELARHSRTRRRRRAVPPRPGARAAGQQLPLRRAGGHRQADLRPETGPGVALPASGREAALDPCETCPSCTMVLAGTHPDLDVVGKPADKAFLPLELFIGDREHRRQEGLCHNISLKPFMGGRKIAVIDDADFLNAEGANCLLKTLEEPPPQSVLILIGTSPAKQLPTIRSRCQLVRFRPLAAERGGRVAA